MRRGLVGALLAVILLLGVAQGAAFAAKTLVIGIYNDLATLDPADFRDRPTEVMLRQVFEGLFTYLPDRSSVGELAESIEAIDPLTWEVKLRRGVTFHDGTPFTAHDAAFSINRLVKEGAMAGRTSPRKGLLGPTNGATVVDDYTIRITTDDVFPMLPRFLPWQMMVSRTVGDGLITQPVGTGPFRFVEWVRGSHFIVDRNPAYWGPQPHIDRVIFRVIPEDASRMAALRAGEVDIADFVPVNDIASLEAHPDIDVVSTLGTRSYFLEMNVNKPPFADVRVRQAMNYALDVDTAIEVLYAGRAVRVPFILSPQAFAYHEGLPLYEYDPARARELLAEAGYPDGFEFTLDVGETHRARAEIYQAMLAAVGIRANIRVWPSWGEARDAWIQARELPPERQRDAFLNDWGNASLDPFDLFIPKFRTRDRGNFTGYSNPVVDELLDLTNTTAHMETRLDAFRRAQEIVWEDVPMVFEFVAEEIYGVRKRVRNWQPSPDSRIHIHLLGVDVVD